MSLFLRFLLCALIVATTSVLAAFAWDHSDTAAPAPASAEGPDARSQSPGPGG